eukprot:scaffold211331_cov27-Prasinocladus_malaysianus.AAC.1
MIREEPYHYSSDGPQNNRGQRAAKVAFRSSWLCLASNWECERANVLAKMATILPNLKRRHGCKYQWHGSPTFI